MENLILTSDAKAVNTGNEILMGTIAEKTHKILTENNLDFTIEKRPLMAKYGDIELQTPYYGLFNSKSGNCINAVKESYTVTQNSEIVGVMLAGVQPFDGLLSVQRAININDGRKILLQLQIDGKSNVNGDIITRYINLVDSNDGTTCLAVGVGNYTLSCQNSFMRWYKGAESKLTHSQSITRRIAEIPNLIQNALNESDMLIKLYQQFESTKCSKDLAHKLVNELLGYDLTSPTKVLSELKTRGLNIMEAMYESIESETKSKGMNLWGLHSGITHYTTHKKSSPQRDNGKIESIAFGDTMRMNNQSLEFARKQLVLV